MQFTSGGINGGYYSAMDYLDKTPNFAVTEPVDMDAQGNPITPDDALNFTAKDIGTTTNPMTGQTEALKARIREGASRIEFSFLGAGKGNAQRPTPESFGSRERQDIRELLNANEMTTSTHAGVHSESLAGFSREGFNAEARANVLKEIKRAIHFAGEATKGGAIVFHTNEWQRPMSEIKDSMGDNFRFMGHSSEDKDAMLFTVDSRTGRSAGVLSKDQEIFRPKFITAKDQGLVGHKDSKGNILQADDWVDVKGDRIEKDAEIQRLFARVPKFDKDNTKFEVEKLNYEGIVAETNKWNEDHKNKPEMQRTPEEMAAILQLENQVLQYKGNSLYHARGYLEDKKKLDELRDREQLLKKIKDSKVYSDDEKRKRMINLVMDSDRMSSFDPEEQTPEEYLKDRITFWENSLKHIHESSASADVMATEAEAKIANIMSAEKYGLDKTAETIALSGMEAMQVYNKNKSKYGLSQPIYVAPENWDPKMYGSHPDEYRKIIENSRAKMAKMLIEKGNDPKKAKKLAEEHIKGTLDIGHLNLFRSYFKGSDNDFKKWLLDQSRDLIKKGYVGHIHLTDNFGYDDEHLSPGQGNVPMKEFLKMLEENNMKDIIVEQGSYNPQAHLETLELINSPIYGVGRRTRFKHMKNAHFGYNAPGFFIAGSYSPSNDWRPWSDIPLE